MHVDKPRPVAPDGLLAVAGDDKRVILVENIMKKDLERDGVQSALFKILSCHSPVSMEPCHVLLPDTLLIDKRVVTDWMVSNSSRDNRVSHKMPTKGSSWRAEAVIENFGRKSQDDRDVVAQFLYKRESEDGGVGSPKHPTTMEYLDVGKLKELLASRTETGILQKFIPPRGKSNETLRVVWTPSVVLMERCRNKHTFKDRTTSLYERTATYDGHAHSVKCFEVRAQPTIDILNRCCHTVRQHVLEVTRHSVDRMVLFFKCDQKNRYWFTHASSIRLESSTDAPCRPLQLEGLSPIPQDVVKRGMGNTRCPSCTTLLFDQGNMITVRQAVKVFAKLSATEEFKTKKRCPADDGGHRISSCLLEMRRAIAHEKGDVLAIPSLDNAAGKKKSGNHWFKVKKDILLDDEDLHNKHRVSPVLRNLFPQIKPSQFKEKLRDSNFLDTQCYVCTPCFLITTDQDLSRKLGLTHAGSTAHESESFVCGPATLTSLGNTSKSSHALSMIPTKVSKNNPAQAMQSRGQKERRSKSVPADTLARHKVRQAKRKELGLPEEDFHGTRGSFKLDRNDDGRLVLPPINSLQAIVRIGMEWD